MNTQLGQTPPVTEPTVNPRKSTAAAMELRGLHTGLQLRGLLGEMDAKATAVELRSSDFRSLLDEIDAKITAVASQDLQAIWAEQKLPTEPRALLALLEAKIKAEEAWVKTTRDLVAGITGKGAPRLAQTTLVTVLSASDSKARPKRTCQEKTNEDAKVEIVCQPPEPTNIRLCFEEKLVLVTVKEVDSNDYYAVHDATKKPNLGFRCVVDTGSSMNMIRFDVLQRMNLLDKKRRLEQPLKVQTSESEFNLNSECYLEVKIGKLDLGRQRFIIVPTEFLGADRKVEGLVGSCGEAFFRECFQRTVMSYQLAEESFLAKIKELAREAKESKDGQK